MLFCHIKVLKMINFVNITFDTLTFLFATWKIAF